MYGRHEDRTCIHRPWNACVDRKYTSNQCCRLLMCSIAARDALRRMVGSLCARNKTKNPSRVAANNRLSCSLLTSHRKSPCAFACSNACPIAALIRLTQGSTKFLLTGSCAARSVAELHSRQPRSVPGVRAAEANNSITAMSSSSPASGAPNAPKYYCTISLS